MKLVFHPEADLEFREAIKYYRAIDPELAADFESRVEEGVSLAMTLPTLWREIEPGIHRVLLQRFPYGVLCAFDDEVFYALAVMHLHREPGYWHDRKKNVPGTRRQRTRQSRPSRPR